MRMPETELQQAADQLCRRRFGDRVTYVINRNANFTNVCTVGCAFCGFQRGFRSAQARRWSATEVVQRLRQTPWVSEVCIQAGIDPALRFEDYLEVVSAVREAFPAIHIHAFSPMEIKNMMRLTERSADWVLARLQECGLDTIPGTAAEILVDEVRQQISGNKLTADEWEAIIRAAHQRGIRSSATLMFGHVETWEHIRLHLRRLIHIQEETGGFTEMVPLAFVPYRNALGRRLTGKLRPQWSDLRRIEEDSAKKAARLYPICRLALDDVIPHLQTSWVKLGPERAAQSLAWGCDDFGGTLYEESITRDAGGIHGEMMEPEVIEATIRSVGRVPVERTTTYEQRHSSSATEITCATVSQLSYRGQIQEVLQQ